MRPYLPQVPAAQATKRLLEVAYPGTSTAIRRLRDQILDFATSPTARVVFLGGPSGVGKSTVARHIAYLKAHAITDGSEPEALQLEYLRYVGPNLIDHRLMQWYVELPLTGLVESIAESQLFGVARGAFTGATERPGVFELATCDEKSFGVKVTGGVVFLDEVGELTEKLQAKLLPVLSNGVFYRLGGEGSPKYLVEYRGVVITASWRSPIGAFLRPDLAARLTAHIIDVPGLQDRAADLPLLVRSLASVTIEKFKQELSRLQKLDVRPAIARGHLDDIATSLHMPDDTCVMRLCQVDWSVHGQLRGLSNAVDKIIVQRHDVAEVVDSLPRIEQQKTAPRLANALLAWVEGHDEHNLAACVRDFEALGRDDLRRRIIDDSAFCKDLSDRLRISEADLKKQATNLARDRRSR